MTGFTLVYLSTANTPAIVQSKFELFLILKCYGQLIQLLIDSLFLDFDMLSICTVNVCFNIAPPLNMQ